MTELQEINERLKNSGYLTDTELEEAFSPSEFDKQFWKWIIRPVGILAIIIVFSGLFNHV